METAFSMVKKGPSNIRILAGALAATAPSQGSFLIPLGVRVGLGGGFVIRRTLSLDALMDSNIFWGKVMEKDKISD